MVKLNDFFKWNTYQVLYDKYLQKYAKCKAYTERICLDKKSETDENAIKNFLKSKNLSEQDNYMVELYNEKKINKNMLLKYIYRKDTPILRGKIHLLLICLSPFWIFYMLKIAESYITKTIVLTALFCSLFNFCASFLLHNFNWKPQYYFFVEKIDHFGIFLMISGSLLPVQFLLFDKQKMIFFIILQLTAMIIGFFCIFFSYFSTGNRCIRSIIYIIAGFSHILFLKDYYILLNDSEFFFMICLSVLYVTGAIIYAIKKPSIVPGFFGFHEVFHTCCLGSAIFSFALNCSVIKRIK